MHGIKNEVRETYGRIGASGRSGASGSSTPSGGSPEAATRSTACCSAQGMMESATCGSPQAARQSVTCCSPESQSAAEASRKLGYGAEDIAGVPEGANLGLGCGNPQAIAGLKPGETVLDLGSGGGFDCFLAAKQVGDSGTVIGVDMTAEMLDLARENAAKAKTTYVEFRLGEIEHLPVADGTIDVILSNCVINLSVDTPAVFRDAFRVLKSGGRLAISDVVATAPLPDELRTDAKLVAGCMGGAALIDDLEATLRQVGFEEIRIKPTHESREIIREWDPSRGLDDYVVSATIEAVKP